MRRKPVPHMRPPGKNAASNPIRAVLEAGERWFGDPARSSRTEARRPAILDVSRALGAAPAKSGPLDAQLRAPVYLRGIAPAPPRRPRSRAAAP